MTRRFLLATTTGTLLLGLSPLSSFAAVNQTEEVSVQVTVAQCRALPSPHSFSLQQKAEEDAWLEMHNDQRSNVTAWLTARAIFHDAQLRNNVAYNQRLVACGKLLVGAANRVRTTRRSEMLVLRPRGIFPVRLTRTGVDTSRRDVNFAGQDRPSRRTIVDEALENQANSRRFSSGN